MGEALYHTAKGALHPMKCRADIFGIVLELRSCIAGGSRV